MNTILQWGDKLLAVLLLLGVTSASAFDDLSIYTEEFPPYNFTENGQLRGFSVELLVEATQRIGKPILPESIHVYPWARSYRLVQEQSNTMLFSMAYVQPRAKLFQWVGPIGKTRVVLLAKKSRNIKITEPIQLLDYNIGTISRSIAHDLVVKNGVDPADIQNSSNTSSLAKLLELERIDLWSCEENTARWVMEQAGIDNREFEAVYILKELDMYFALNNDVAQTTVEELQNAIDDVLKVKPESGRSDFQDIVARYLPE